MNKLATKKHIGVTEIDLEKLILQQDYLGKNVKLHQVQPGDCLLMHDTGAYGTSLYSKFHSIPPNPVYGFRQTRPNSSEYSVFCLKGHECYKEILDFWGPKKPVKLA